jgi:hypothetical protein
MPNQSTRRFWLRVDKTDGCWLWRGYLDRGGYGQIRVNGVFYKAHRYAWQLAHNRPVPIGMLVCHACDNRRCVRWDHLFIGTCLDNMQDASRKGRMGVPQKLTAEDVRFIRSSKGVIRQSELAERFGVSDGMVGHIQAGRKWKSLDAR